MKQIRHTGIYVDDLNLMKEFYCESFNMKVAVHDTEDGSYICDLYGIHDRQIEVELYKLEADDGSMIELLKLFPDSEINAHSKDIFHKGCAHIAFTVLDVDRIYKVFLDKGIFFYSEPLLSRDKKHKVCICRDPEGNYLELVQELK